MALDTAQSMKSDPCFNSHSSVFLNPSTIKSLAKMTPAAAAPYAPNRDRTPAILSFKPFAAVATLPITPDAATFAVLLAFVAAVS